MSRANPIRASRSQTAGLMASHPAEPRRFKLLTEGGQPDLRVLQLDKSDLGGHIRACALRPDGSEAQSRPLWIPGSCPPRRAARLLQVSLSDQGLPNVLFIAQRGKRTEHGKSGTRLKLPCWYLANLRRSSRARPLQPQRHHPPLASSPQITTNSFAHYALLTPGLLPAASIPIRSVSPESPGTANPSKCSLARSR